MSNQELKPLLVLRQHEFTSFTSYYLENFWKKYFNITYYDQTKQYEKRNTIFAVWWKNLENQSTNCQYVKNLLNSGHKVVVDYLWEIPNIQTSENFYILENKNWFWYNESLWWQALKYDQYRPNKHVKKLAFMPIGKSNKNRDIIVNELTDFLDNFIWSYSDKVLPNNCDKSLPEYQRFVNYEWYDNTYLSLVVETNQVDYLFNTEKSYKPIAFYHPFMIAGRPGALSALKNNGFETFDNLFDESYDSKIKLLDKLTIIKDNLSRTDLNKSYDKLTLNKLEHNHNHFYNTKKILNSIEQEIVLPLLNYADS